MNIVRFMLIALWFIITGVVGNEYLILHSLNAAQAIVIEFTATMLILYLMP